MPNQRNSTLGTWLTNLIAGLLLLLSPIVTHAAPVLIDFNNVALTPSFGGTWNTIPDPFGTTQLVDATNVPSTISLSFSPFLPTIRHRCFLHGRTEISLGSTSTRRAIRFFTTFSITPAAARSGSRAWQPIGSTALTYWRPRILSSLPSEGIADFLSSEASGIRTQWRQLQRGHRWFSQRQFHDVERRRAERQWRNPDTGFWLRPQLRICWVLSSMQRASPACSRALQAYRRSQPRRERPEPGTLALVALGSAGWPPCAGARSTKQFQPRPKRPPPAWRFSFRTQAKTRVGNRVRRFAGAVAPRPASARTVGAARPLLVMHPAAAHPGTATRTRSCAPHLRPTTRSGAPVAVARCS